MRFRRDQLAPSGNKKTNLVPSGNFYIAVQNDSCGKFVPCAGDFNFTHNLRYPANRFIKIYRMSHRTPVAVNSKTITYQDGLLLGRTETNVNQVSLKKMDLICFGFGRTYYVSPKLKRAIRQLVSEELFVVRNSLHGDLNSQKTQVIGNARRRRISLVNNTGSEP